jgi:N-acetylneuraminic acid mutarotase
MNAFPALLRRLGICLPLFATQLCVADAWVPAATMPTPRKYLVAASLEGGIRPGNTIYVVGGRTEYLPNCREYNPILLKWTARRSMPTPRAFLAAVTLGGSVYAIGGTNGKTLGVVEIYDPNTDSWTSAPNMLNPRDHFAAAVVGSTIYVIGGLCGTAYLDSVEAYDPNTGTWTNKGKITPTGCSASGGPMMLANHQAAVYGTTIYVVGGTDGSNYLGKLIYYGVYDLPGGNGKWYLHCTPFTGRTGHAMVAMGNQLCVFGGKSISNAYFTQVDVFEPVANPRDWGAPLPGFLLHPRRDQAAAMLDLSGYSLGLRMYAMGGRNSGDVLMNSQEEFSVNAWSDLPNVPEMQDGSAAVAGFNKLGQRVVYLIGGYAEYLSANEVYFPDYDVWDTRAVMPTPRSGLAVAAPGNGRIYAVGGTAGNNQSLAVNEEYDPFSDTWTGRAPMPTPRRYSAAAAAGGKLYVIGGVLSGTILASNEEYNPATNTWATKASMPTPRFLLATASVGGKIYAFGGATALFADLTGSHGLTIYLDDVEIYDPATDKWTTGKSMPTPRAGCGAAASDNGMIYVSGGFDGTWSRSVTERYNPLLDQWVVRASLTTCGMQINTCQGLAMVAPSLSTSVFVMGGENTGSFIYDIGGNLTSSGTIFRGNQRYERDPAKLVATVRVLPNPVDIGKSATVYLAYTNAGDVTATILVPSLGVDTGGSNVTLTGGPFPSPGFDLGLLPGESAWHSWTYAATAAGQVRFCGSVDGTDELTAAAISATACNFNDVPLTTAYAARFTCSLAASPLPLARGATVSVVLAVSNPGGGTTYDAAASIGVGPGGSLLSLVTGPVPSGTVTIFPGAVASFTWSYSVVAEGYAVFTATVTGRDDYFGPMIGRAVKPTQPSPPTGVAVTAASAAARVTWNPNPAEEAVIRYIVYRSETADFSSVITTAGTTAGVSFNDTGLENGRIYHYRVKAESADGISMPSASVMARPISMPPEPGGVRITTNGPEPLKVRPARGDLAQVLVNVPPGDLSLKITVYTLAGERVRTVYEEFAPPGPFIRDWDCRNDRGHLVASGGYLIVVEMPDGRRVIKKVAIIR